MIALLLSVAISVSCDYTYDLTQYSGRGSIYVSPNQGYCLRFTAQYGVIFMNQMGYATGSVYYSSSGYYSSSSYYNYDSLMQNDYSSSSSPRVISYGPNYGLIVVSSTKSSNVYYSYSYANSTCTQLAISNVNTLTYSYPNSSTFSYSGNAYCFIYMRYGSTYAFVTRSAGVFANYDQMYYRYGIYNGVITYSGASFGTITAPLQTIFIPFVSGYNDHYIIYISSSGSLSESKIEGTIYSLYLLSKLYKSGYCTATAFPVPGSSSSSIFVAIGSVFGAVAFVVIMMTIIRRHKRRIANISDSDYDTNNNAHPAVQVVNVVPRVIAPPPSPFVVAPPMLQPYDQYSSPQNAQLSINVQPYSIPAPERYVDM